MHPWTASGSVPELAPLSFLKHTPWICPWAQLWVLPWIQRQGLHPETHPWIWPWIHPRVSPGNFPGICREIPPSLQVWVRPWICPYIHPWFCPWIRPCIRSWLLPNLDLALHPEGNHGHVGLRSVRLWFGPTALQPHSDPTALQPHSDPTALQPHSHPTALQPHSHPTALHFPKDHLFGAPPRSHHSSGSEHKLSGVNNGQDQPKKMKVVFQHKASNVLKSPAFQPSG